MGAVGAVGAVGVAGVVRALEREVGRWRGRLFVVVMGAIGNVFPTKNLFMGASFSSRCHRMPRFLGQGSWVYEIYSTGEGGEKKKRERIGERLKSSAHNNEPYTSAKKCWIVWRCSL